MRTRSKIVLVALVAAALLASAVGVASARNFSVNERNFEFIWNPALTGKTKLEFRDDSGLRIRCDVTLLGRFSANTIAKRTETEQGTINHGEVGECEEGTYTLEGFPWRVRFRNFTGRLPVIETIALNVIGARFIGRIEVAHECTLLTEVANPAIFTLEFVGGSLENVETNINTSIPLVREIRCPVANGQLEGRGLVRNLPRNALLRLTLI